MLLMILLIPELLTEVMLAMAILVVQVLPRLPLVLHPGVVVLEIILLLLVAVMLGNLVVATEGLETLMASSNLGSASPFVFIGL